MVGVRGTTIIRYGGCCIRLLYKATAYIPESVSFSQDVKPKYSRVKLIKVS